MTQQMIPKNYRNFALLNFKMLFISSPSFFVLTFSRLPLHEKKRNELRIVSCWTMELVLALSRF